MQTYDAMLRLGGDLGNTLAKSALTASEVILLRAIHGSDAVVEIKPKMMDKRVHADERKRLSGLYGEKIVTELFGHPMSGAQLPVRLDDVDHSIVIGDDAPEDEDAMPSDGEVEAAMAILARSGRAPPVPGLMSAVEETAPAVTEPERAEAFVSDAEEAYGTRGVLDSDDSPPPFGLASGPIG